MNKYQDQNGRPEKKREQKIYTDYSIFQGKVRLVLDDGTSKIVERDDAIEEAKSAGKNLVQIGYNKADFPHSICKIIDYGKFLYDQNKKQKSIKKQERLSRSDVKEIFFTIRIDENDMNTKINHAAEFLNDGDKVKVNIKLMRREMDKMRFANEIMNRVLSKLSDIADVDSPVSTTGNIVSCVLKKKK